MKTLLVSLFAVGAAYAQTPAAAPKHAATTTHRTTTSRGSLMNPASLKARAPDEFKAKFVTTNGEFTVEVHRDWAPLGADRFYNLVKAGFFDSGSFFRVVPGFVVQFGLSPKPAISAVWEKANIQDDPVKESNKRGYLVFATSGPNTRTTQLFINLVDNQRLDAMGFAPFGTVTEGMDVVDKINPQYGESPDQGKITAEGKAYLDKEFPKLDSVKTATIIGAPAATPAKPAVHRPATPAKAQQ